MKLDQSEQNFIINLITHRRALKLSQEAFAKEIGVTEDVVSNWERYKTFPRMQTALFIANYFNSDIIKFCGDIIVPNTTGELLHKPHDLRAA